VEALEAVADPEEVAVLEVEEVQEEVVASEDAVVQEEAEIREEEAVRGEEEEEGEAGETRGEEVVLLLDRSENLWLRRARSATWSELRSLDCAEV
jgi:hypothetical protein